MAKFTAEEIDRILLLFRRYLTTNRLKLKLKDKEMMVKGIHLHKFTCLNPYYGMLGYEQFSLPVLLNAHPTKDLENVGEGLDKFSEKVFKMIRHQVFIRSLVSIMDGELTDQITIYAALIECGHACGVLPKAPKRNSKIKEEADCYIKNRNVERETELFHN